MPQLVYQDSFPVARLSFLDMKLYAYSAVSPGDTNSSNTPAVVFTLHATAPDYHEAAVNISFMVIQGVAFRNDFAQNRKSGGGTLVPGAASRTACAAACEALPTTCHAWQWGVPATAATPATPREMSSTRPATATASPTTTGDSYTLLGNADWTAPPIVQDGNTAPKAATLAVCEAACSAHPDCVSGLWLNGTALSHRQFQLEDPDGVPRPPSVPGVQGVATSAPSRFGSKLPRVC